MDVFWKGVYSLLTSIAKSIIKYFTVKAIGVKEERLRQQEQALQDAKDIQTLREAYERIETNSGGDSRDNLIKRLHSNTGTEDTDKKPE
jgi:hypothetical protein